MSHVPQSFSIRKWAKNRYHRHQWQKALATPHEYPASRFKGRGLVFCAGGDQLFINLWVNLCLLRRVLKCNLPIEVWHFGKKELTPEMVSLLEPFAVRIVDGESFAAGLPKAKWRGFALKALSIINSSFQEILFLDADNYAVRDPSFLFDEPAYRWAGSCFWPDIQRTNPESQMWSILDIPFVNEAEWESGQLLVDKNRTWRALSLVGHLNWHYYFHYRHMYGDKMTFYAAWKKLDLPYAMTRSKALLSTAPNSRRLINQFDLQGDLLFQHRTTADWTLSSSDEKGGPEFVHQKVCEEFLEELRQKWPESARNCSPNQKGKTYHLPGWQYFQAIGHLHSTAHIPSSNSFSENEKWDATARHALLSPHRASPRLMNVGIESLADSTEKEARAIFRFFAALIFIDPRLIAMLPENLETKGTTLHEAWNDLLSLAQSLAKQKKSMGLLCVHGNLFSAKTLPALKAEELILVKKLTTILATAPSDIWQEWHEFWRPALDSPEKSVSLVNSATQPTADSNSKLNPWHGKVRREKVLVLTPIKDAADLATSYCHRLSRLNYPSELLSIGMLESDSRDQSHEAFDQALSILRKKWRRVELWKNDYHYQISVELPRWHMDIQLKRREILARSRNELLHRALKDEDWVLWLDADVIDYPRDIIEQLLSYGKEILHPHCVLDYQGATFDQNGWREHGRVHMEHLRGRELLTPLDAVGGTMLFIRADLHRKGLIFPPTPYGAGNPRIRPSGDCLDPEHPGEIETEGLGIMASDMGVQCWGLPDLEILHRKK